MEPGDQENWSLIMNICDRISAADNGYVMYSIFNI